MTSDPGSSAEPAPRGAPHVLHVGSGFRPLRWGGLVAYIEDLSAEQVRQGWRVSYLFSGRHYRWPRKLRLKRWRRDDMAMLEIVNSPLYDHGRQPELEVSEPGIERIFERILEELRPDVVHIQELAGLPSSLLEVAKRTGAPVVMTLQDYFPLCSTFKLLDADGQVCLRREVGADCRASVGAEDRSSSLLFEATVRHDLLHRRQLDRLSLARREALAHRLAKPHHAAPRTARRSSLPPPATFQRRREINVERLNGTDRLIAMSTRVAEIYEQLGVGPGRVTTMQLTLAHIDRLTPRSGSVGDPLTFATLGGGESVAKGSAVLLQAARQLTREIGLERYRLLVFGQCEPSFERAIEGLEGVERRSPYRPDQLDELLGEVDVGIMPSIWEEAYGYAGIEFIAKGIPVIANPIGGMGDYVREGQTGWFNRSSSGRALGETMHRLIAEPEQVEEVTRRTREARDVLVVSIAEHAGHVAALYREVGAAV